jgi:hypothetical protein
MRLEHDHHFKTTSGTRFHADHTYLCIGVVQITNGESSEIFCPCWVGGRHPVDKRMRKGALNKARCVMLRNIAKGVTFRIHLRQNILEMYPGKHGIGTHRSVGLCLCLCRDTLGEPYIGEYMRRVLFPERHLIKRRLGRLSRWMGATDT